MKPPYCRLCGKDFRNEWFHTQGGGDIVRFSDYEPLPDGFGGMASGCDWFCSQHQSRASDLTHLSLVDALATLESEFGSFSPSVVVDVADPTLWVVDVGDDFARVFAAFRHATGLVPSTARDRLNNLPTLVASGWPAEFKSFADALTDAGAQIEVRYD